MRVRGSWSGGGAMITPCTVGAVFSIIRVLEYYHCRTLTYRSGSARRRHRPQQSLEKFALLQRR
eukprot:5378297-Prymnesium_polylepis.1